MTNKEINQHAEDMVEGLLSAGVTAEEVAAIMVHAITHIISLPATPYSVKRIIAELVR